MEKITGNEPAMPMNEEDTDRIKEYPDALFPGLTIRQHFAAMAMQGLLYQNLPVDRALNESSNSQLNACVSASVKCADALIAELNKTT
jgi:hypothetical protein